MTIKKFAVGVMDAYLYDNNDNLIFYAKTMIDTAFDVKLAVSDIRGGRGNKLLYKYYHTSAMTFTLTDAQFNLDMLAAVTGNGVTTGANVYTEETVTLATLAGTVVGTPIADQGTTTIYGWVTLPDQTVQTVTFTGKNFSVTGSQYDNATVCVRYFNTNSAVKNFTIPANIIPKQGRLVLDGLLTSGDVSSNKIGTLELIAPSVSLLGDFNIALKSNGVATTPIKAEALAFHDASTAACGLEDAYCSINEILDSANWYDGVTSLAVSGGNFTLATTTGTKTLEVYAIIPNELPFVVDNSQLTFTSGTPADATVGAHTGLVTGVATGSSLITVAITSVPTVTTEVTVTVP